MAHHTQKTKDFTSAINNGHSGSDDKSSMECKSSGNKCEELKQVHAAVAPHAMNASPDEVHAVSAFTSIYDKPLLTLILLINQALEEAQNLLLVMHGKFQVLKKRNALLEAQKEKGHRGKKVGNLSNKELSAALNNNVIRAYSRKYSATHCLWIVMEVFPLRDNPEINLSSAEGWLFPLAIEDGVKTKLFKFISKEDHGLMLHKGFGNVVSPLKTILFL